MEYFYEIMLILKSKLTEEECKKKISEYEKIFTQNKGQVEDIDYWGVKDFAYPIEKETQGVYVIMYIKVNPDALSKFNKVTRIDSDVVRTMILKYNKKMLRHRKLEKENRLPKIFNDKKNETTETIKTKDVIETTETITEPE